VSDRTLTVALITPGQVTDGGWSQSAFKGLKRIETELKAKTHNAVAASPREALEAFRTYASNGANLVFGHASEWFDTKLFEIAGQHPKTQFLISGCELPALKNVAGIRFVLEDACYVLGFLAGSLTQSGVLGCVGPVKVPVIESTFYSFELGAKSARPDVDVRVVWTNSWDDVATAKERTLALIAEKADLIFHNANNGGPGVFQAVQAKKEAGVLAFGSNADQAAMAPDVVLASAVLDIPRVFLDVARDVRMGTRAPGQSRTLQTLPGWPQGLHRAHFLVGWYPPPKP
jgi:basic membrane lipoprotein Med (substrate-binding protein (PBP1-ABC) superfamily)